MPAGSQLGVLRFRVCQFLEKQFANQQPEVGSGYGVSRNRVAVAGCTSSLRRSLQAYIMGLVF